MEWKEKMRETARQVGYVKLILLAVCGIFLLYVSFPESKEREKIEEKEINGNTAGDETELYAKKMEQRLEEFLGTLKGVGKVKVMITLSASKEKVVNKDESLEETREQEKGENEKESDHSVTKEETVLTDTEGEQIPYVIKTMAPMVEGVVIAMEGGDDPVLEAAVTEAVQALFPVEVHKIKVLKMEDGS